MLLLMMTVATPALANHGRLALRGGEGEVRGLMTLIDSEGITVETQPGVSQRVLWDQIRDVDAVHPDARLEEFLPLAEDLWRARSRLQRHDARTAEPLFERLFERYRGQTNETALIVAEGLLRCRLARQANEQAVVPFLEVVRLQRAGLETDRFANLPAVIDDALKIAPSLPPVWTVPMALPALERELTQFEDRADGDDVVRSLAALYRVAVRKSLGEDDPGATLRTVEWDLTVDHPGVALLHEIITIAMTGDPPRRSGREARLRRQTTNQHPQWVQAWKDFARGMHRMNHAANVEQQQRGCLRLMHVPALYGDSQPYLAALALHHAAQWHERQGRADSAKLLREELKMKYPHHPLHHVQHEAANIRDRGTSIIAPTPQHHMIASCMGVHH